MKAFISALILFLVIVGLTIGNAVYLVHQIDDLIACTDAGLAAPGWEDRCEKVDAFAERWQKHQMIFGLSISHVDLTDIEEHLSATQGACTARDNANYLVHLNKLKNTMNHLRGLAGVGIDNII